MKKILFLCLCISTHFAKAQNITAAEYFFDTDPGVGNGIPTSVGASGPMVNFTASVPTAFPPGFHYLAVRVKDANNSWSLFETRGFYVSNVTANTTNIVAAEYFFDTDPGVGNAITIPIASGTIVNFTTPIPTAFSTGFHYLAIRTKDAEGKWSLFEKRGFYVSFTTANTTNIVAAEYFIDTDPGAGNGIAASIGASGAVANFTTLIPIALSPGFHYLAIRTKDAQGKWDMFETRGFYISSPTSNMPIITAAEYFYDTDPGVGNAVALTVPTPGNSFNEIFSIPVPIGLSQGEHFLAIRVKDQNNNWGLFDFDTLTVSGTLPLHLLSFTGKRDKEKIVLNWRTDNELNTSHFIIERSANGATFDPIGRVTANNNSGINNYAFDDLHPFNGINFYRLRQVDIDAQFKYSPIVKILMSERIDDMKVYPNPATDKINIEFATTQKNILINIFDATGKLVSTNALAGAAVLLINTSSLAKGTYWMQVSDGLITKQTRFIKK